MQAATGLHEQRGLESFEDRPAADGRRDWGNRPKFGLLEGTGKISYMSSLPLFEEEGKAMAYNGFS